jgi:hypothetical protein
MSLIYDVCLKYEIVFVILAMLQACGATQSGAARQGAVPWNMAWQMCGAVGRGAAQAAATPWRGKPGILLRLGADILHACVCSGLRQSCGAVASGAARCGATASGAATTAAAPGATGLATRHVGRIAVTACGASESGAAGLRCQAAWRGTSACNARRSKPGNKLSQNFAEIHKQQRHSKLSRKSQAGCAKVTNPS